MRKQVAIGAALVAAICGGCGGGAARPTTASTTTTHRATLSGTGSSTSESSLTSTTVAVANSDAAACEVLYARLQVVSNAISASSELIAHSINKKQLSGRIAIEREQLLRSAQVLTGGAVPSALVGPNRQLIAALIKFSDDFARAAGPARHGDFRAAVAAMDDEPTVHRILAAATTIQNACQS
jgi:hypothetical protein